MRTAATIPGFAMVMVMLTAAGISAAPPASTRATAPATSQASLPHATLVTLHLKDAVPLEAFAQLFEQAGLTPMRKDGSLGRGSNDIKITGDWVDQPFLPVLKELCRRSHFEPSVSTVPGQRIGLSSLRPQSTTSTSTSSRVQRFGPTTQRLRLGPTTSRFTTRPFRPPWMPAPSTARGDATTRPSWIDAPACVFGPFMIVPREVIRNSSVPGSNIASPPRQTLRMVLLTMVDPKLYVYSIPYYLRLETAQDADGNSLLLPPDRFHPEVEKNTLAETWQWMTSVDLAYPTKPGGSLALLRGKMTVTVVTRMDSLQLDHLDNVIGELDFADVHFSFGKLEQDNTPTRSRLPVTILRGNRDEQAWNDLRTVLRQNNLIEATDDAGRRLWVNQTWRVQNDAMLQGSLVFSAVQQDENPQRRPSRPTRIVWNIPFEANNFEFPVEFRDLPLP